MFPTQMLRTLCLGGSMLAAVFVSACASENSQAESNPLTADIIREGTTTTPALDEFLGAPPDDWGWAGGQFQTPTDMATLPASAPQAFTWQADSTSPPNANDVLNPNQQQGQVFLLIFSTPASDQALARVFTSEKSFTPAAATWQKLVAAGASPITLSVTSGTFENDQLTHDGGPHTGQTIHFTIQ